MKQEPLVTAKVIADAFDMPRTTLYRLVKEGRVPAYDITRSWHINRRYGFRLSEVRQALTDLDDLKISTAS
jgi:predicted DNA-binding transcriptional regulator AlpA